MHISLAGEVGALGAGLLGATLHWFWLSMGGGMLHGPACVSRIESYSCKRAGDDKHMFKQFCQEGQPHVLEALSPPQTSGLSPSR